MVINPKMVQIHLPFQSSQLRISLENGPVIADIDNNALIDIHLAYCGNDTGGLRAVHGVVRTLWCATRSLIHSPPTPPLLRPRPEPIPNINPYINT